MRPISPIRSFLIVGLLACATACFAKPTQPTTADQVKKLVAVLKSDASQKEKADACRELARIGTKEAVAPLAALLPDERLSHMARYGLETIPDPAVDKALRDAAGKLRGQLLAGVIGSIGVRRDPKAVKLLTKLLRERDGGLAYDAARSLGSIGNKEATRALLDTLDDASADKQFAICEGLLRCAEAATARGERVAACDIYDRLRQEPGPEQVRAAALRGAILTRQQEGLPLLERALVNGDFALFGAAVRTAQEMAGPEVANLLGNLLADLPADRQIVVLQALARISRKADWPGVYASAPSASAAVRIEAIRALAQIGDLAAVPRLVDLLGNADKDIAAAAQESLASLPGAEVDSAIMKALAEGAPARRLTAMDLIVRRHMTSAIPALFDAAGSSEPEVRVAAVKKLGELAGPADLPRLLDLLGHAASPEDLEATEQTLSAVSLKATDPAACVGQVQNRLAKAPPAQQCALIRVLGAVGGTNALQAVRAAVSDPNTEVHGAAIRVLGGWSTADAAPLLLEVAKATGNATDRMICLRGYLRLAGQPELPVDKRLAMCHQAAALAQKDDEKKLLLAALGGITSVEALNMITPYLDEAATREEAATAAVDVSEKLLKDKDAKLADKLADPLSKVAQATSSPDLAKRARDLRDQAKSRSSSAR